MVQVSLLFHIGLKRPGQECFACFFMQLPLQIFFQRITSSIPFPGYDQKISANQVVLSHTISNPLSPLFLPSLKHQLINTPFPCVIYNISMKLIACVAVLLLLTTLNAQKNEALLALSWYGGFCEWAKNCIPSTVEAWDHQSFTIHGFWAQKRSSYKFGEFNVSILSDKLLKEMKDYWPAQSRKTQTSPTFLWEHEYAEHGSDFADIYLDQHPDQFGGLNNRQQDVKLQQTYFSYVIDLYKTLKVQKVPKAEFTKAEFAELLGLNVNEFSLVCNEVSATLQEIRICYDMTSNGAFPTKCRSVQARNCKNNKIVLGGWRRNPNAPVTRT